MRKARDHGQNATRAAIVPAREPRNAAVRQRTHHRRGESLESRGVELEYVLDPGGPLRVRLSWERLDHVQVFVDGVTVHAFTSREATRKGATIPMPEGAPLTVRFRSFGGFDLRRRGVPLPGSAASLGAAGQLLFVIAAVGLGLNLVGLLLHYPLGSRAQALSLLQIPEDLAFFGLAALTVRGSRWALRLAIAIWLLGGLVGWVTWHGKIALLLLLVGTALLARPFIARAEG